MKIVSLFDGISCGRVALERLGVQIETYIAYEIDKNAIQVSRNNYPDIIHCGDVCKADFKQYKEQDIDLLIAGSPCQGFSNAGKKLNFDDPRSKLYFEFERAIEEIQPKYFLLENVSMKQEWADIITERLGVEPIIINSNLVSAQNRKRMYWTNIPGVSKPNEKGIELKNIIHELNDDLDFINLDLYKISNEKTIQVFKNELERGKILQGIDENEFIVHKELVRLNKKGSYLFGCLTPERVSIRQNGRRFNLGDKFYTLTTIDRHGILIDGYLRKLTPIECERLQTLPDNYTAGVSESQRYKCLGNAWTVDVISWILSFLEY